MEYQEVQELERVQKIRQICQTLEYDPLKIYCLHSGRIIGEMSDDTIRLMLQHISETLDLNTQIEQILFRCVLSMRPSPAWIQQSYESLKLLTEHNPAGVIVRLYMHAYKQNYNELRIRAPKQTTGFIEHSWQTLEDNFRWNETAILLYKELTKKSTKQLTTIAVVLLEADAIIGLSNVIPPNGQKILKQVDLPYVVNWSQVIQYYRKAIRKQKEQNRDGNLRVANVNSLSRGSWMEYLRDHKPPTQTQIKAKENRQKFEEIHKIAEEIFGVNSIEIAERARKNDFKGYGKKHKKIRTQQSHGIVLNKKIKFSVQIQETS